MSCGRDWMKELAEFGLIEMVDFSDFAFWSVVVTCLACIVSSGSIFNSNKLFSQWR